MAEAPLRRIIAPRARGSDLKLTILHTAECVRLLLEAGADVSERNNDGLGRAYKEQGEIESAIEHYEKALAVDPLNNLALHQREALAELRAGKAAAN